MAIQLAHKSHWASDGTCSYCGSISPETLFTAIEQGKELDPTDKNYKVYVTIDNPDVGKPWVTSQYNFIPSEREVERLGLVAVTDELRKQYDISEHTKFVRIEQHRATKTAKFYFQHLNEEEQTKFVELMNAKKLNIGYPGHFYRLPFFVRRLSG